VSLPLLPPLEFTLRAEDGLLLRGELRYPARKPSPSFPLAVLAHQWPATRASWGPLVEDLHAAGIATLAFDLRGHGDSTAGPRGPMVIAMPRDFTFPGVVEAFTASAGGVGFAHIPDDILLVANWGVLQNFVDGSRVVLLGASVGGSGVLVAAPRVAGLRAVATLGAAGAGALGADGPARVRAGLEAIRVPAYLATSDADVFDGASNARGWSEGLAHVRTRIVGGRAHAMGIYYEVREELVGFLAGAVAG
jgi:alpha-beta hydrolase superfamily lysophospholipase